MSVTKLLVRFGIAYLVLLVVVGALLYLVGIQGNSGANTAALLGAVMWACLSFAQKNRRYFEGGEKLRVVLGMVVIDLVIQAAFSLGVAAVDPRPLPLSGLALVLLFLGALHALVIYVFVGLAGRQFAKQIAKTSGGVEP